MTSDAITRPLPLLIVTSPSFFRTSTSPKLFSMRCRPRPPMKVTEPLPLLISGRRVEIHHLRAAEAIAQIERRRLRHRDVVIDRVGNIARPVVGIDPFGRSRPRPVSNTVICTWPAPLRASSAVGAEHRIVA